MQTSNFFAKIDSWKDYVEAQKLLNNKEKGNTFELLTKLYFKISPKYSFYENVWLLGEVPEKILNEIGLPRQDLGVDLIAKTGNEYHAIQCKYHSDKHQAVTFREVSTFLSAIAKCDKISMGYICSTANVTSKNYDKVPKKLISKILSDTWENLSDEFFNNVRASLKRKPLKLEVYKPRPHQKKAISNAINHFKNNDRGKLIFPCGSGKSLTGFWITRELNSKNILIAVPSLSLIKQTLDVYLGQIAARKEKVKWLCICSDDGIGKSDDVFLLTEDIGVPCVTDPEYISNWLKKNKNDQKIIFTTYQSGKLIGEISKKQKLKFDLGIFDEAHKTVGSGLSLFSYLLFEKNINIDKRVFMTATERFYSGIKDDIVSMDDPDIYGEVFCKMTFKDAIKKKLLTDYKIITLDIKESEISDFIIKNGLIALTKKWKNKTDARSLASMIALRKLMEKYPINNAVSFHSSIEKAKRNSEVHTYITKNYKFSPITTYTVSGKQPTSIRNDIVNEFARTKKALITNARCLTEGVDVPNIDCIVFADPKKSKIDIVQALGRALRKKEGKEWGYVILPVVYDINNEIDNESFNDVISIIRGLAANDERIIEYFKTKSISRGGGNKVEASDSVFEMISEKDLSEHLEIKVWEKLSRFSWMPFEEAREFVRGLNLKTVEQWYLLKENRPSNIPSVPKNTYKNAGWSGWGDFLGIDNYKPKDEDWMSFNNARLFVRKLGLKNVNEWYEVLKTDKIPYNIPHSPTTIYKNKGWKGYGDWIGTDRIADQFLEYLNFDEARKFMADNNIKSLPEWKKFRNQNKIKNIPAKLYRTYSQNWKGEPHFFDRELFSYKESKKYIQKFSIKSSRDYKKFIASGKANFRLPGSPHRKYKNKGWSGWKEFLGYKAEKEAFSDRNYVNYIEVKQLIKNNKICSITEWNNFRKQNKNITIPSHPERVYKDQWKGWKDFLGKN